ncbi:hypothetical protein LC605_20300 [Nostoc sp. CHAB 5836]|nr:hypothetical protein [Nostoc sp. CHAB 5836]
MSERTAHGATELIYLADNPPTPTLASEFRVVFDYDLAHFADLVGIQYLSVKGKRGRGKGKEKTFNLYPLTFSPNPMPS